ncbi:MAG: hypothetical protein J5666_06540 [Bacilli bacterium]|nr:hypothetical protein [Bacilli bacterium]
MKKQNAIAIDSSNGRGTCQLGFIFATIFFAISSIGALIITLKCYKSVDWIGCLPIGISISIGLFLCFLLMMVYSNWYFYLLDNKIVF